MAKRKKFEHKAARPTLAASLEAVRQGKSIEPVAATVPQTPVATHPPAAGTTTDESLYVKAEMRRIGLIMGLLLSLLVGLSVAEGRTSFLTKLLQRFFSS